MVPRIAYVNGRYLPYGQATLHIEDRGTQFADAVYEVLGMYKGRPIDLDWHWARLFRSLGEIEIPAPFTEKTLTFLAREVTRRNRVSTGTLYVQISRGIGPRNHTFNTDDLEPSVVILARNGLGPGDLVAKQGVNVVSYPDLRWKRCDIKTVGLLPNIMAKQNAKKNGGFEALLIDQSDGTVTECGSSNVWIIDRDGTFITRPLGNDILPGVTRNRLAEIIRDMGGNFEERAFSLDEAKAAKEVFLSSTGSFCLPVVRIDDHPIGNGAPGLMAQDLRACYIAMMNRMEGPTWL